MIKPLEISLYNQDRFDDETFLTGFVARKKIANTLLNGLRDIAHGGPTEHRILIGTRGMGKTSLLRRLAIGISTDTPLSQHFIPLRFREEQYNIISLDAFWRNCGEALAEWCEQNGNQALADRLDIAIETDEWRDDDKSALAFLASCIEAGGRAVLLLDNLDLILDALGEEGCWKLRGILQKQGGPIVIGAATQYLTESGERNAPFYEFFHPHILEPLSAGQLLACMRALADARGEAGLPVKRILAREPERVRALYVLTGGNPRVLTLLYQLLERVEHETIFADLEALLDQVTPFYKARIEEYQTPLQRAVIDAIALNWDPITSGAISQQTGTVVTTISAQLSRLKRDGLIEEVSTSGARSGYQLCERFLNIWYLMRHGTRKTKQRLRWFTIFLTKLFSTDELQRMAGNARGAVGRWHPNHCEAVIEAYETKLRNEAGSGEDSKSFGEVLALFSKALEQERSDHNDEAIVCYNDIIARHGSNENLKINRIVAISFYNRGLILGKLDRIEDEISSYNSLIELFGTSVAPDLQGPVAMALVNKGWRLGKLGQIKDEIAVYDDVITRFGKSNVPDLQVQLAMALNYKGVSLGMLGRANEEIAAYDDVILRFGHSDLPALQERVAITMVNKGFKLGALDRIEDAVAVYNDVLARFGKSNAPDLQFPIATALASKGISLGSLGLTDDEIATYDELIARFGASLVPRLQKQVARTLINKGALLQKLARPDEAISAYDFIIERLSDSNVVDIQLYAADAMYRKCDLLTEMNRSSEALEYFDNLIKKLREDNNFNLENQISNLQFYRGWILFCHFMDKKNAEIAFREASILDNDDIASKANLIWVLITQHKIEEARDIFSKLDLFIGAGRDLWEAGILIGEDEIGKSLRHLGMVLDIGLDDEGFNYFEALLWYLRFAAECGYGERLVGWFLETGNSDRYAPIFGALVAHVRGERFLLDLNPEVRSVAQPLYARLSAANQDRIASPESKRRRRKLKH